MLFHLVKMLLERGDVNPDPADKYGRRPVAWVAGGWQDQIVNIFREREDVCTSIPDSTNQTPQPLAPPEGHGRVAKIPPAQGNRNCTAVDLFAPISLPPSALPRDECVVEMQPIPHNPNTNATDLDRQPAPLLTVHNEQPRLPDLGASVHNPAGSQPSAQSPGQSQPPSIWLLRLFGRPRKNKTYPSNT